MKKMKRFSIYFLTIVSAIVFTGCSGMLDVPRTLPLLQNLMVLFGLGAGPGVTAESVSGAYFVSENNGILDISVVLNSRPSEDVVFTTASSDETEATLSTTEITFTPSNWNIPQIIQMTGEDDFIVDGNQDIFLIFGSVVSADTDYSGMAVPALPVLVLDDETYSIVVSPLSLETTEAAGDSHTATFYVGLSTQPAFDVVIPGIASTDESEGGVDRGTLTFTPEDWDVPQAVTVTAVDDGIEDGHQAYYIEIGDSESLDVSYNGIALGPVSVTNLDAQASIIVTPLVLELVEGGGGEWGESDGTFTVVLGTAPSGDVTISVASEDESRATVNRSLLTFTTSNWDTPQTVTVSAVDNGAEDPSTPVMIDLGTATGGGYDGKEPSDVRVYIEDNDGAGIRVSRMSRETTEAGQNATFRVRLNKQPAAGTTVTIPINDTYDIKNYLNKEGIVDKLSLTFNDANWAAEQIVTVTPERDYVEDGDVQYIISLLNVVSGDPDYHGKKPRNVTVNNFDADVAGFVVTANGTTTEMGASNQSFNGFATDDMGNLGYQYANFEISLRSKPLFAVTLNLTSSSTHNDGTLNVSSLAFTPSNWNVPQTVRVTGASDGTNEGNLTYVISFNISTADTVYGNVGHTYVGKPSFNIRSCDNDESTLIVDCACTGANTSSTTESGGQASFYLITQSEPGSPVNVNFDVDDATEGAPPADGTVVINTSNYNRLDSSGSNRVVVTGVDDVIFDGTVTYHLDPEESTGGLAYEIPGTYTLTNSDNEQRYVTSVTGHTSEDGDTATINVRLGAQPSDDVVMAVACTDATECQGVTPTELTFTNGNWNSNQEVTVTGEDDTIADGNVSSNVSFTVTSSDGVFNGQNFNVAVINDDNEPPAKAVWVTSVDRNGEMAPGVSTADAYCNGSDPAKPTGLGSVTYKALLVDGDVRIATTTGTDDTGQTGWVLKPNHHYYLRTGASGNAWTTRLFIADAYGLIPFPMERPFSASGSYWTGMNVDMTTAATYGDNCSRWNLTNSEVDPFEPYFASYGGGGVVDSLSVCSGTADCNEGKRIICVQQ